MRTALLFPGQGAPAAEWREAVASFCPDLLGHVRQLLDGSDPFERFGAGTEFDQPAIYCASLAAFEIAGRPDAEFCAGHSLGEISALACAGAFAERDGLRLVVERGRLMAAASRTAGSGAMLAVRGSAAELAELAERDGISIANLNSPSQTVLSGAAEAIEEASSELAARGVKAKRLAVSGAFHSPQMASASREFERVLARFEVTKARVPVLSGRTGRPFEDVRAELAASLLEPVRWIDVVATLERAGIERYLEIGPGKALVGLVRRTVAAAVETKTVAIPEVAGA